MRSLLLLAASAAVAAFGAADAAPLTSNVLTGCVAQYDASVDYFPDKVAAAPGDAWTITYQKSYKVLSNPAANETYVLYQCGTPEPTVAGANEYIPVPIDSTSISDTTVITYHELLGKVTALDYVDAFTIGLIVSPCAQKEIADKGLKPLDAANETLKEEEIASTDLYTEFSASNMTDSVVWTASRGTNAARRNYVKYLGVFFNEEAQANRVASTLEANYNCTSTAAKTSAANTGRKPVIAFVEYQAPSDFNEQKASWQINMPPYKAEFIADVGGVSPSANTTSYSTINDFLAAVRSVDYLVDETFLGTTDYAGFLETYGLTANSSIPFVKNKKVYRTDKLQNGEGWTAWFESAVALNHIMLADLASEVHPGLFSSYTRTFLRNVATEALNGTVTIATAAQCTGPIKYDVTCPAAVAKPAGAGALRAGSAMALAAVVAALLL